MNKIKHWQVKKLREICTIVTGSTPRKSKTEYYGVHYPFFKPSDFDKSYFLQSAKDNLSNLGIQKARFLPKKSVLVVCIGSIGKVGLTRTEGSCNQQINAIIANNEILMPEFIYFYAISNKFQNLLKTTSSATTLAILNKSKFENLEIPFPSLDEQNLIVKKIEDFFEKINFAVLKLQKSKELIEIYKQSVLSHAFSGKLTNSNLNSWQAKKLKDVGKISSGGTPSTSDNENFGGNIAWITPADLSNHKDKFISHGKRNLSEKGLKNSSAKIMPKGTVLFSSRAPIGYVAIAINEICTNQGFKSITPNSSITSEFIYYYLLGFKNLVEKFASGTTFKEISARSFSMLPIPLPNLKEQNLIVSEIEKCFKAADNALNLIEQSLQKAEILKQSILQKAFNGELIKDKNE